MKRLKFWVLHFNGDHSLVQIAFINFLALNLHIMVANALPTVIFVIENPVIRAQIYMLWLVGVFGLLLPWQWIGLVRAAWFEWTRLKTLGGILTALLVSVFSTYLLVRYVAPTPQAFMTAFQVAQSQDGFKAEITRINESTLSLSGELQFGTARKMEGYLRDSAITTLELSVTAGQLYEARRLASFVEKHGTLIRVDAVCLTPCTLILASGGKRTVSAEARIGFQSYKVLYPDDRSLWFVEQNQRKDMKRLEALGVDNSLIQKSFYTQVSPPFWEPGADLLLEGGWIDAIVPAFDSGADAATVTVQ